MILDRPAGGIRVISRTMFALVWPRSGLGNQASFVYCLALSPFTQTQTRSKIFVCCSHCPFCSPATVSTVHLGYATVFTWFFDSLQGSALARPSQFDSTDSPQRAGEARFVKRGKCRASSFVWARLPFPVSPCWAGVVLATLDPGANKACPQIVVNCIYIHFTRRRVSFVVLHDVVVSFPL